MSEFHICGFGINQSIHIGRSHKSENTIMPKLTSNGGIIQYMEYIKRDDSNPKSDEDGVGESHCSPAIVDEHIIQVERVIIIHVLRRGRLPI